jgi:hypothetical protein
MKYSIKQLSIFIENKKGELTQLTEILSKNKISIKAINLVDGSDFGILRILVDDSNSTKRILDDNGFSLTISEVFAIQIDDHIGSFYEVISLLSQNDINIEYTYTINSSEKGAFIFKVSNDDFTKATKILSKSKVKLLENI